MTGSPLICPCGLPEPVLVVDGGYGCLHHRTPNPSRKVAFLIHSLTQVDSRGRIAYTTTPGAKPDHWLRSPEDYAALNRALDAWKTEHFDAIEE